MPIYEYVHDDAADAAACLARVEVLESMKAEPLECCPRCGARVHRVLSVPAPPPVKSSHLLSPSNLAEKGFTQYKRTGAGEYQKSAGQGPDTILDPR